LHQGMQLHAVLQSFASIDLQGCVAFLPCLPVTLKSLRRKEWDFEPRTIGDHVRKRRLQLGLTQVAIASTLKVDEHTIVNSERGDAQAGRPPVLARIIRVLGYDPAPAKAVTLPEKLRAKRREMGWSQLALATDLGVDAATIRGWEHGRTIMKRT